MEPSFLNIVLAVAALVALATIAIIVSIRRFSRSGSDGSDTAIKSLEAELSVLRSGNADLQTRLAVEEHKASGLPVRDTEIANLRAEIDDLRGAKETIASDLASARETNRSQAETLVELRARHAAFEATAAAQASKGETLTAEKARLEEELAGARGRIDERDGTIATLEQVVAALRGQLENERLTVGNLRTECATLQNTLMSERSTTEEKLTLLVNAKEQMTNEFKALSGELLKNHGETLTNQNKEQLASLLDPMRLKLAEFQQGLQTAQTEAAKEQASLKEHIRLLSDASRRMSNETQNLTVALKGKAQTQGAWGEMILSTILEKSGLRKDHEYLVQQHALNDEGARLRPDVIVSLPNDQKVVVDAKVSLTAFEQAVNAETEDLRGLALNRHLDSIKGHIRILGSKDYQKYSGGNLDYVIMFVPIEGALASALDADPSISLTAAENNVAIATPTTLMIALRTIASLWQVERRNRNADDIAARAGRLFDKFVGFVDDLTTVGNQIDSSRRALDSAMGKLSTGTGNLVRQADMLKQLGAKTQKSLPAELLADSGQSEPAITTTENEKLAQDNHPLLIT